jgi:hypothetical protein
MDVLENRIILMNIGRGLYFTSGRLKATFASRKLLQTDER